MPKPNPKKKTNPAKQAETCLSINRIQIEIGAFMLLLGVAFYLLERPPNRLWLFTALPLGLSGYGVVPRLPTWINGSLPTFLHSLSLTVITGGLTVARTSAYVWVSISWLLIHVMFELGQGYGRRLVELDRVPLVSHVRNYFVLGTFDEVDIVAAFLGCASALSILMLTRNRQEARNP